MGKYLERAVVLVTRGGEGDVWLFHSSMEARTSPLHQPGDVVASEWAHVLDCWGRLDLPMVLRLTRDRNLMDRLHERARKLISLMPARRHRAEYEEMAREIWPALLRVGALPPVDPDELKRRTRLDRNSVERALKERLKMARAKKKEADVDGVDAAAEQSGNLRTGRGSRRTVLGLPLASVIETVTDNPKRPGSAAHARYDIYQPGMTLAEALSAGVTRGDLCWDLKKGFLQIAA